MREGEGFVRAIAEDVYDDAPRLIYADWLEDHGDPERAEFIRVQCELEPMRDRYEIDRAGELHARERELLQENREKWLGAMPPSWDLERDGEVEFRRGFVDEVAMTARAFLAFGPEILRLHPTVRRLVLHWVNGYGERLAACAALAGLPELELACWYSDADAEAIAASPHLGRLQVLELWLGRRRPLTDARLCRLMAGSKAWPALRELSLLDPDSWPDRNRDRARKRLVSVADQVAGRKVAVYRRGYPDLFPFAADFWYTFPGYLPDGRMAMANEDARTSPPTLCVITFDRKGRQTKDVIRVPMPPELLSIPPEVWFQHKERMKQQLIDEIGLRPGFIRVRDCRFPGDEHGYNRPYWDEYEEVGMLDSDDDAGSDWPTGYGGWAAYHVRETEWVFGWDRYGDKRGRIHST